MDKALQTRDDIDWFYLPRKEGWRLASIVDCIDAAIRKLEEYTKKANEGLTNGLCTNHNLS